MKSNVKDKTIRQDKQFMWNKILKMVAIDSYTVPSHKNRQPKPSKKKNQNLNILLMRD